MSVHNELNLISLMPQSPQTVIENSSQAYNLLSLYQYFIEECIQSLEHIFSHEWHAFDPQVGENQCQIRAYYIFLLAEKYDKLIKIQSSIIITKEKVMQKTAKFPFRKKTLSDFLSETGLNININSDLYYLIQCKFLTNFGKKDQHGMYVSINYDYIIAKLNISKTIARKIVHKFQVYISTVSCSFVLSLLENNTALKGLKDTMKALYRYDEENRATLPLFFTSEILARAFTNHSGLIILTVIDEENNSKNYCFSIKDKKISYKWRILKQDLAQNCIVLRAKTLINLKQNEQIFMRKIIENFKLIWLANEAAHPQYPGKILACKKNNLFAIDAKN
jgi:hypothetical protein